MTTLIPLYVLSVIFIFIIVGLGGYFLYLKTKVSQDPEYDTWIFHGMAQYSEGHAFGKVIDEITSEDRTGFTFSPRDINVPKELKKNKNKLTIKPYTLFFRNEHIEELKLSTHCRIIFASPPKGEYFPKDFRETIIGKIFMEKVEEENHKIDMIEILRSKTDKQNKMLMQTEGQEIAEDTISQMSEAAKTAIKNASSPVRTFGTPGQPTNK